MFSKNRERAVKTIVGKTFFLIRHQSDFILKLLRRAGGRQLWGGKRFT
jgi:hypothetical protein